MGHVPAVVGNFFQNERFVARFGYVGGVRWERLQDWGCNGLKTDAWVAGLSRS